MSQQNQLFLKLFGLYLLLFGGLTFLFNYLMGYGLDLKTSVPLFVLFAGYLSFRRSRNFSKHE